jgi:hypothetical protein
MNQASKLLQHAEWYLKFGSADYTREPDEHEEHAARILHDCRLSLERDRRMNIVMGMLTQ